VGEGQPTLYFYPDRLGRIISHYPGFFQIQTS
jgi:hypothetical protein